MKNLLTVEFEPLRNRAMEDKLWGSFPRDQAGIFLLASPNFMVNLRCIVSSGDGWDHVSVSLPMRCPTWEEMEHVKRKFFKEDEVAMQLHVPAKDHINCHPFCLHLWRPHDVAIPLPPQEMVA